TCAKAVWWCAIPRRSRSTRCSAPTTGSRAGACWRRPHRHCSWSIWTCSSTPTRRRNSPLMRNGHARDVAGLIEPGRVHRDVYTDPELFELEMERIFGRAWLFVGHTSQVPQPGDYITTDLGRQPVVMTRHRDGSVHVLLNRCTHRGAKVVNERKGNAPRLVCCYHGWSFAT